LAGPVISDLIRAPVPPEMHPIAEMPEYAPFKPLSESTVDQQCFLQPACMENSPIFLAGLDCSHLMFIASDIN